MVTANVVQDQLRNVQVFFFPLPFVFDLVAFQLLVVTAHVVQDQFMNVHVLIRCTLF